MAKLFKNAMSGLMCVLALWTLASCSGDEKEEPKQLVGRWELLSSEDEEYWEKPCIFRFSDNNMLTITFAAGSEDQESVPCKYTTKGSKLKIDFGYGDDIYEGTYKINNNILTLDIIGYDAEDPEDVYTDFLTLKRIQ